MRAAAGLAFLALLFPFGGCGVQGDQGEIARRTLTVFAAGSLVDVFDPMGSEFEGRYPQVDLVFNFAASDQLAQQLVAGAPADVFASANLIQMDVAVAGGRVAQGSSQLFARNRMVIVTPLDNPGGIRSLADLAKPGLRLVIGAADVPAGRYARQVLETASGDAEYGTGFAEGVLANVRSYEETVRAVLTKVVLGEADAGIVFATDAGSAEDQVRTIEIPLALNTIADYPIAVIADANEPELARDFVAFVLSPAGQSLLSAYGFVPVSPEDG